MWGRGKHPHDNRQVQQCNLQRFETRERNTTMQHRFEPIVIE
jgi:hypothetical protein